MDCGFQKIFVVKKMWMKVKCESLASLPAPLPSLASICLPLPLPLPATGVHTFNQGCMSFIQRAVYCVCLISTTTDILSNWRFSWVATEVFRFYGILGFEGGYFKEVCNYCNRVYILPQGLLFSRWVRALPRLCDAGERYVHFVTRNCSLQCHTLFCHFRLSPALPIST